jgi:hypothetical protein
MKRTFHTVYAGPPIKDWGDQFLTVNEFAKVMRVTPRHVRRLATELAFSDFGIPIVSVPYGGRGKRTIYIFSPAGIEPADL